MAELTDIELIYLYRGGNERAFEILLMRYQGMIANLARKYYLNSYDFDDLYQVGAAAMYSAVLTYIENNDATFYSYCLSCVRNSLSTLCRTDLKRTEALQTNEFNIVMENRYVYEANQHEKNMNLSKKNNEDLILLFDKLIQEGVKLGEIEKTCIEMVLDGLTYTEIATTLDVNIKSVWNAVARGRIKFKQEMNRLKTQSNKL